MIKLIANLNKCFIVKEIILRIDKLIREEKFHKLRSVRNKREKRQNIMLRNNVERKNVLFTQILILRQYLRNELQASLMNHCPQLHRRHRMCAYTHSPDCQLTSCGRRELFSELSNSAEPRITHSNMSNVLRCTRESKIPEFRGHRLETSILDHEVPRDRRPIERPIR